MIVRAARVLALALGAALLVSVLALWALRFISPWTTAFIMEARVASWFDDDPRPWKLQREWRDLGAISPQLQLAVIASEDQRFPEHSGFDYEQIQKSLDAAERTGRSRGASTISQQVAKNLFLWGGRSWVRKGFEAWFTVLIEWLWPKRHILEMYLNIAQFGRGVYGAEAAAQAFFHKPATRLTASEAARMAAVLPNPKRFRIDAPSRYVLRRQGQIEAQMRALGGTDYLSKL
ncbi:MAG: monofunctional biosynthetic peptidoglycan transglycosylase [Pseudomonadota bacterium]